MGYDLSRQEAFVPLLGFVGFAGKGIVPDLGHCTTSLLAP